MKLQQSGRGNIFGTFTEWHALFFVFVFSIAISTFRNSFQFFLVSVAQDLHVGRSLIAAAVGIFIMAGGLFVTPVGWLADRVSIRSTVTAGTLIIIGSALTLSFAQNAYLFVFVYGVLGALGFALAAGVPTQLYLTAWFKRNRAFALAIIGNSSSAGLVLLSPVWEHASTTTGWRATYLTLSIIFAVVLLPIALIAMRLPKDYQTPTSTQATKTGWGAALRVAAQSRQVKMLIGGLFACGFTMGFVDAHMVPMMHDHDLGSAAISTMMSGFGAAVAAGGIAAGWISDRLGNRRMVISTLFWIRVVGFFILMAPLGIWRFSLYSALFGITYTGILSLSTAAITEQLNRGVVGTLIGIGALAHQSSGFLSVWLGGLIHDITGSYDVVLLISAILSAVAGFAYWKLWGAPMPAQQLAEQTAK